MASAGDRVIRAEHCPCLHRHAPRNVESLEDGLISSFGNRNGEENVNSSPVSGARKHDPVTPSTRGPAIQSVLTKVKTQPRRKKHGTPRWPVSAVSSSVSTPRIFREYRTPRIELAQNIVVPSRPPTPRGNRQPATHAPAKGVQTFVRCE